MSLTTAHLSAVRQAFVVRPVAVAMPRPADRTRELGSMPHGLRPRVRRTADVGEARPG